ncbi:MAG TPA: carboxypeptidase regulatory-like domain-containing protein [Terriglobales bacterium]|nr:carboxypeptidase regulatory-like domain-containing protein [Terriglobales bacterium]
MARSIGSAVVTRILIAALLVTCAFAQESTVKGAISAMVTDPQNAIVTEAQVTVTGPTGSKTYTSGSDGRITAPLLTPGVYSVKVEKKGFKTAEIQSVEVVTGKTSALTVKLDLGATGETVEVRADAQTVDTTSTAVGTNLNDTFYNAVPIARNVGALFSAAPGVVSGGGTGTTNPSISGSSGLENLYVADGVNIGNSAYGGIGVYTAAYGSVGTGINLSFIKEVNVKTAGFEPQYGQATGGIVQIVTKSGGNSYHGAFSIYGAPIATKARGLNRDDVRVNKVGIGGGSSVPLSNLNAANYDVAEFGGYVPKFKDHLFFFGSFNPNWQLREVYAPAIAAPLVGLKHNWDFTTLSYSGKLTFKLNDRHQVEASIFGDPTHTNTDNLLKTMNIKNDTGYSSMNYGTRNMVGRYNGTLSPTWLVNASGSWSHNYFTETPKAEVYQVVDRTATTATFQGFGLLTNYKSNTISANVDTQKVVKGFGGSHTLSVGYRWENPEYDQIKHRSGARMPVPQTNLNGQPITGIAPTAGHTFDSQWFLNATTAADCPQCPVYGPAGNVPVYLALNRGEYGAGGLIPTHSDYQAAYANDSWAIGRHVNLSAGIRWEQQHVVGTNVQYTFTDNWAPRIGVTVDPMGDGKTKIFANFGRYNYQLPLDAAVRQLSSELDLSNLYLIPEISGNTFSVIADPAHVLNNTTTFGGVSTFIGGGGGGFGTGTRMTYEDEFAFGAEREFKGIAFSARYIDRRLKRIIEDVGSVSPEGSLGPLPGNSIIANPSTSLDLFVNEQQKIIPAGTNVSAVAGCNAKNTSGINPAGVAIGAQDASHNVFTPNGICFPNAWTGAGPSPGGFAGDFGADGIADGFVNPVRNYSAFELEANKQFSKGYMFRVNYRWAKLNGNYEGAYRNDNGQSDPGISSLFDFTAGNFNLLGNQFASGPLNTDRRHVLNTFFAYTLPNTKAKGLTLGTTLRVQQGTPIQPLGNHPVYNNAGEIPIGGRGSLGRTPVNGTVDLKAEYPWKVSERMTLKAGADLFNIANSSRPLIIDQGNALGGKAVGSNPDFLKPFLYQQPFYARFSLRLEF